MENLLEQSQESRLFDAQREFFHLFFQDVFTETIPKTDFKNQIKFLKAAFKYDPDKFTKSIDDIPFYIVDKVFEDDKFEGTNLHTKGRDSHFKDAKLQEDTNKASQYVSLKDKWTARVNTLKALVAQLTQAITEKRRSQNTIKIKMFEFFCHGLSYIAGRSRVAFVRNAQYNEDFRKNVEKYLGNYKDSSTSGTMSFSRGILMLLP